MRRNNTRKIALGGMLAAVAVVIMCLGGLIPVATYICPVLCCMTAYLVLMFCGNRIAWAWFCVVVILSVLMGPDKEAAVVFLFLGYYPIIKGRIEQLQLALLVKVAFFNVSIMTAYFVLIRLLGMDQIAQENAQFGVIGLVVLLVLGNITYLLLDRLLDRMARKNR